MISFESKFPNVGTTIFTVMSKMAAEYGAVNLSQGFPNFPVDSKLTDILKKAAKDNIHQYSPMAGNSDLLEQISELIYKQYYRKNDSGSQLLITAGATEAIFASIQALVHKGEEVIIFDPSYDCYEAPIVLTGGVPIRIPMTDDMKPDWDLLEQSISTKTRMVIINNPHNPSGRVLTEEDLICLESILDKYPNVLLLSDEVYEFITFEDHHISINSRPHLRDKSIIISSFGKTFHITGWKIGYLIAPSKLTTEIKKVHQFLVFSVNSVAQYVLSEYLKLVNVSELKHFYQAKRDYFRALLEDSRFELLPCEGTYFQLVNYSEISSENDINFCEKLIKSHGVAAIPLSVFNKDSKDLKLIRFCFAKENSTLENAAERLCKI